MSSPAKFPFPRIYGRSNISHCAKDAICSSPRYFSLPYIAKFWLRSNHSVIMERSLLISPNKCTPQNLQKNINGPLKFMQVERLGKFPMLIEQKLISSFLLPLANWGTAFSPSLSPQTSVRKHAMKAIVAFRRNRKMSRPKLLLVVLLMVSFLGASHARRRRSRGGGGGISKAGLEDHKRRNETTEPSSREKRREKTTIQTMLHAATSKFLLRSSVFHLPSRHIQGT